MTSAAELPGASRLARSFDPRAKTLAYLLFSAVILLATRPAAWLALGTLLAGLLLATRLARRWLGLFRTLLPTLLLFGAVAGVSTGLEAAAGAVLRLLLLTAAGTLFFASTPAEELGEALLVSGLSPQLAFLLEGSLGFVPTMSRLLHEVRDAQSSRGIRLDGVYLLRNGPALLAPLLISAMRFADVLAEALETRGFGSPRRTPLQDYRFRTADWLLLGSTLAFTALVWLLLG